MVLLLSDLHFSETVSLEETYGINAYNSEIAKERIKKVFTETVTAAKLLGASALHIQLLGDMVNGEIQEGLMGNDMTVIDSALVLGDFLAQCIREAAPYFAYVEVNCVVGNHGRLDTKGKPYFKNKVTRNWDYLLYHFMKRELAEVVPSFEISKSPFMIDEIQGYGMLLIHGDSFSGGNGWSMVPSTINRDVPRLAHLLHRIGHEVHVTVMGHFHSSVAAHDFSDREVILNGPTVGATEFSLGKLKKGSIPSQVIFLMERGRGVRFRDTIACA